MTLTTFTDNSELFRACVCWFTGYDQTITGFPILPSGVTPTPNGTWTSDLSLGNNKSCKTFNGSTNYISLSDDDAWQFQNGDFTIAFWIKFNTSLSTYLILNQYYSSAETWFLYYASNHLQFNCVTGGSSIAWYVYSWTLSTNTWYHVTLERFGTSCILYINSEIKSLVVNVAFSATVPNYNIPLNIGKQETGYLNGNIKDLMIFKGRALTAPEITTLYRLTAPGGRDLVPVLSGVRGVE